MFKVMLMPTRHGWSVNLTKYSIDGELVNGFTLITFPTEQEQIKYAKEFMGMTDFGLDE